MLCVYVASFYSNAHNVRLIHSSLRQIGCRPTSTWAHDATGPEDFAAYMPPQLAAIAESNYRDLEASDAIFVVDPDCRGQETLCELGHALSRGIPAVVIRPKPLSVWRPGVLRVPDVATGIVKLVEIRDAHAIGIRGFDLARGAA